MRTTPEENVAIGEFIAHKLNACHGPVRFLLPEGGVSMMDAPGQPFHDPEADEALFATIEANVVRTETRTVGRVAANINDEAFVEAVLAAFDDVMLTVASDATQRPARTDGFDTTPDPRAIPRNDRTT